MLLQTATVPVQSSDRLKTATIKVLFDSTSHRIFMTDKLAKMLQLSPIFEARKPQEVST